MSADPRLVNESCPTIYGPVRSRRHGLSLGINLGSPSRKVCSWGCLYCQCGFGSRDEISDLGLGDLPTGREVVERLREAVQAQPELDSVTFAGNSEPGAHPEFLWIVREVRKLKLAMRARWILNALTNGSELDRPEVVSACDLLDEAWVKLDCAEEGLFQRLNRPVTRVGTVAQHLERIRRLRKVRIQTLLWKTSRQEPIANWTEANRAALLEAYQALDPVEIHLTTVSRDPAYAELLPAAESELATFAAEIRAKGYQVKVFAG